MPCPAGPCSQPPPSRGAQPGSRPSPMPPQSSSNFLQLVQRRLRYFASLEEFCALLHPNQWRTNLKLATNCARARISLSNHVLSIPTKAVLECVSWKRVGLHILPSLVARFCPVSARWAYPIGTKSSMASRGGKKFTLLFEGFRLSRIYSRSLSRLWD